MKAIWPRRGARGLNPDEEKKRLKYESEHPLPQRVGIEPTSEMERIEKRCMPAELLKKLIPAAASSGEQSASTDIPGTINIIVNNVKYSLVAPDPDLTLAIYLRTHLGLTGTKISCGEGGELIL